MVDLHSTSECFMGCAVSEIRRTACTIAPHDTVGETSGTKLVIHPNLYRMHLVPSDALLLIASCIDLQSVSVDWCLSSADRRDYRILGIFNSWKITSDRGEVTHYCLRGRSMCSRTVSYFHLFDLPRTNHTVPPTLNMACSSSDNHLFLEI